MSYITHFPQDTRQHSETNAKEIVLNQRWRPGTADISKRLVSKQRDMFRKKFWSLRSVLPRHALTQLLAGAGHWKGPSCSSVNIFWLKSKVAKLLNVWLERGCQQSTGRFFPLCFFFLVAGCGKCEGFEIYVWQFWIYSCGICREICIHCREELVEKERKKEKLLIGMLDVNGLKNVWKDEVNALHKET